MVKVPAAMGVMLRGRLPGSVTTRGPTVSVTVALVALLTAFVTVTVTS
jgi:hypothetical protein